MTKEYMRWISMFKLFDPEDGIKILDPPGEGSGFWAGAPSIIYDSYSDKFYLYYRRRKPREQGRGYECGISVSDDGIGFREIWSAPKECFGSISVERAALVITPEGMRRIYIGYVAPEDNRWKIDMIEADSFENLDPASKRLALAPEDCGVEGVKDPYVMIIGGKYYMFVSYAPSPVMKADGLHTTADVFNTGKTSSNTGLALSSDGIAWEWYGDVLSPQDDGWNAYAARITCMIYNPPIFNVFYDGGASVGENYEERTGLAMTFDLLNFQHVSETNPILVSPHSSGSLRYMDVIRVKGKIYFYYEYARRDGSHELRMNIVED